MVTRRRRFVSTTVGSGGSGPGQSTGCDASASRMFGGRAMPTALKMLPTSPVAGVRRMKCLPSCSVSTSCRRSSSLISAPHSVFMARGGEAVFERLAQHERQERAEHVAANGGVLLMINRPGVENGLGRSEDVLDFEKLAVAQHDGERVEAGVGAQDIETVIARVLGDALLVDLEMRLIRRLEVASVGAVADQ